MPAQLAVLAALLLSAAARRAGCLECSRSRQPRAGTGQSCRYGGPGRSCRDMTRPGPGGPAKSPENSLCPQADRWWLSATCPGRAALGRPALLAAGGERRAEVPPPAGLASAVSQSAVSLPSSVSARLDAPLYARQTADRRCCLASPNGSSCSPTVLGCSQSGIGLRRGVQPPEGVGVVVAEQPARGPGSPRAASGLAGTTLGATYTWPP
jgi:hypothetical protein